MFKEYRVSKILSIYFNNFEPSPKTENAPAFISRPVAVCGILF
jgi:hypothetical protein